MATGDLWQTIQYFMDWIGIFAFALSGALLAVSKDFNIFGAILLAEAAGLGGGVFRDLVIGVTPVAFTDVGYCLAPLVGALIVFFTARAHRGEALFRAYDLLDAAVKGVPLENSVSCGELVFCCGIIDDAGSISRCCCRCSTGW